jgi:hypothetical protein
MSEETLLRWMAVVMPAIAAALTAAMLFVVLKERRRKEVETSVLMEKVLVGPHVHGAPLKVTTEDGRVLTNPHNLVFIMRNTGNVEVRLSDFETGPVRVTFPGAELIQWGIMKPPGLAVNVMKLAEDALKIDPLLLNPGDKFIVSAILDGLPRDAAAELQLAGTNVVSRSRDEPIAQAILNTSGSNRPSWFLRAASAIWRVITGRGRTRNEGLEFLLVHDDEPPPPA